MRGPEHIQKKHRHLQLPLTSNVDELPEKLRKRLKNSCAGVFYREFFCRLNEAPFEMLYVDFPSRPNVPVNVLVGLEYLKAGNGWTDEEMYDNYCYDSQVRYALGYCQLGEGDFNLRTLYYYRERLSRQMQKTGIDLLDQAFKQVTDQQIAAFRLKTGEHRTSALAAGASVDGTLVAFNIRRMGRVQLLVEVLQRVKRILNASDQEHYAVDFEPYLQGHVGQYVYHMKIDETDAHLQRIGELMQRLLFELKPVYVAEPIYQVLERVFGEHFQLEQKGVVTKPNQDLSTTSLQSPDNGVSSATCRLKRKTKWPSQRLSVQKNAPGNRPGNLF